MPLYVSSDFSPNAVQPVECLKAGWELIKNEYWLFLGMTVVALLIGQIAPMGVLLPPMMCGLYLALFRRMRGVPLEFSTLFEGFEFFGQSLIALLLHLLPVFAIFAVVGGMFVFSGAILVVTADAHGNGLPAAFIAMIILVGIVMAAMMLGLTVLFSFAYPLIVDRRLSGTEAVKLSVKAGWANFGALAGLLLLSFALGIAGLLCCYLGVFLVMPVTFAASACAYQQVFGLTPVQSMYPPPPPSHFR